MPFMLCLCLLLGGCAGENAVKQARPVAEQFLLAMSQGKYAQAHELCDPMRVSESDLRAWATDAGNQSLLKGYKGVNWKSGGHYIDSNPQEHDRPTLQLPDESTLVDRSDVKVKFLFRREESNRWVIIGFWIKSGN